jgi:hypothetical protein
MRAGLILAAAASGCLDYGRLGAGVGTGAGNDLAEGPDMAAASPTPDMAVVLQSQPDLSAAAPDMRAAPDMAEAADLLRLGDMATGSDLSAPLDLSKLPDLLRPPDLAKLPDLFKLSDLAQPPADLSPHSCNRDAGTTCPWDERCMQNNLGQTLCGTQAGCGSNGGALQPCCWFGPSSGWGCDTGTMSTCQSDTSSPNGTRCK